jgi:hypothetical protein
MLDARRGHGNFYGSLMWSGITRRQRLIPIEEIKNFEIGHNFVRRDSQGTGCTNKNGRTAAAPSGLLVRVDVL